MCHSSLSSCHELTIHSKYTESAEEEGQPAKSEMRLCAFPSALRHQIPPQRDKGGDEPSRSEFAEQQVCLVYGRKKEARHSSLKVAQLDFQLGELRDGECRLGSNGNCNREWWCRGTLENLRAIDAWQDCKYTP